MHNHKHGLETARMHNHKHGLNLIVIRQKLMPHHSDDNVEGGRHDFEVNRRPSRSLAVRCFYTPCDLQVRIVKVECTVVSTKQFPTASQLNTADPRTIAFLHRMPIVKSCAPACVPCESTVPT